MTDEPSGSYTPGGWVALAGSHSWVLLDVDPSGPLVSELWQRIRRGSGSVPIAEMLELQGGPDKPSFGLVEETDTSLTIALGGRAVAEVSIDGSQDRVDCPGFAQSVEYRLGRSPAAVRILSTAGVATGARLPLRGGVVQAGEMLIEWESISRKGHLGPLEGTGAEPRSAATLSAMSLAEFRMGEAAGDVGRGANEDGAPPPAEPAPREGAYDHLFGHTVQRAVEDAAIRSEESEASVPAVPPSITERHVEPVATAQPTVVTRRDEGIIDAIPWARTPTGDENRPPPQADAVELTISRADQLAIMRQMTTSASVVPGPTVHAVRCPAEHANPAHADVCRVCGAPIADQPPATVCRPPLGVLRMSTGDLIPLDRGVILGRSPAAERPVGGDGPHLVKLPSPGHDISRSHLELSLDGWHVLVTDLNSTNGTLVTRPGQEPERLRPQQPTMIEPGTIVTLADEVSFLFEATA